MVEKYKFKFDINMTSRKIDVSVIDDVDSIIALKVLNLEHTIALRDHLSVFISLCNKRDKTCEYLTELSINKDMIHKHIKFNENIFSFEIEDLGVPKNILNEIIEEFNKNVNNINVSFKNNIFIFSNNDVETLVDYVFDNVINLFLDIYKII
jgi:hypothetical protein